MIKSATIIEVILALVIIMLTMGIALMIYLNVVNSTYTMQKFNARLLINDISINTIKNIPSSVPPFPQGNSGGQAGGLKGGLDKVIEKEELIINKNITPYKGIPNLSVLHLEVLDKHKKKLAERKELIVTSDAEHE